MNIGAIITATVVVAAVGLFIGIFLSIAGKKFAVETDEREVAVREALPGNNCGGCGYPGCDGLAAAIAKGEAPVNACPVGGAAVAGRIGAIMGVEVEEGARKIAQVMCTGGGHNKTRYDYVGLKSCLAISRVSSGPLQCSYGCLGGGDCVDACKFDAIHIVDGVAKVDFDKCVACGACAAVCPRHLIDLVPYKAEHLVQCNSHDKGADVKKKCDAGCIGCTLCTKQCEADAIHMDNNVAVIDYEKCTNCGKCAEKCPAKVIL